MAVAVASAQVMSGSRSESHSVLLIGSTGSGKSTLGNFLLNPDVQHMFKKPTVAPFTSARDNKPETKFVQIETRDVQVNEAGKMSLTVIDTPGLNESPKQDLKNMLGIIKHLQTHGKISACIFVVKFNAKIDEQYKRTIQYYRKLLPSLFERNVLVVMTDFATDDKSIKRREKQGINVEEFKSNVKKEISEHANMIYEPKLFVIDCLPIDNEETRLNLEIRNEILEYIGYYLVPIEIEHFMIAKTDYIKEKDMEQRCFIEGKISGYNEELQKTNEDCKEVLRKARWKERCVTNAEIELQNLKERCAFLSQNDTVTICSWSVNKSWLSKSKSDSEFNISSPFKHPYVKKWAGRFCYFEKIEVTVDGAKGKVASYPMCGIHASVELQTSKLIKYADEIDELATKISNATRNLTEAENSRDDLYDRNKQHAKEIQMLKEYIKEKKKKIIELSSEYMTISEASKRLQAFYSEHLNA